MTLKKDVETRCPSCGTRLVVDALTGHVLRAEKGGEGAKPKGAQFDEVVGRVAGRGGKADAAFGEALREEAEKKKRLEDAFEKAKKKAAERADEPEPPPGFNW